MPFTPEPDGDLHFAYKDSFDRMVNTVMGIEDFTASLGVAFCARLRSGPGESVRAADGLEDFQTMFKIFNDPVPILQFDANEFDVGTVPLIQKVLTCTEPAPFTFVMGGTVTHIALFNVILDPQHLLKPIVVSPLGVNLLVTTWQEISIAPSNLQVTLNSASVRAHTTVHPDFTFSIPKTFT